jgi:D-lactate dehydrogenase
VGPTPLQLTSSWLNRITNRFVPVWNPYMPKGASPLKSEGE